MADITNRDKALGKLIVAQREFTDYYEQQFAAMQGVVDAARPFVEFARQYPLRPNVSLVVSSFDFEDVEDLDTNHFFKLQAALAALDKLQGDRDG